MKVQAARKRVVHASADRGACSGDVSYEDVQHREERWRYAPLRSGRAYELCARAEMPVYEHAGQVQVQAQTGDGRRTRMM